MAPSLSQVLAQGGAAAHQPLNPLFLLAGITVFFLAAFSAVKSIEIYRRRRLMPPVFDETQPMAEIQSKEEAEKLSFIVDEMKCEKENLAVHNSQLQGKIQELNDALSNVKQARDTMEKSNLALLKESTRLKTEKEELLLKSSKPLVNTEPQNPIEKKPTRLIAVDLVIKKHKKHKKAKSRTVKPKAIKPIAAKKGDRGRPARVKKKVK